MYKLMPVLAGVIVVVFALYLERGGQPQPEPVKSDPWEEHRQSLERVENIGYLGGTTETFDPVQTGVTVYDPDRAQPGLNFYTSGHEPAAFLMDMEGNILHNWSYDFVSAFGEKANEHDISGEMWRRAWVTPEGDLFAIFDYRGLIKIDRDSRLLWARWNGAHHDLDLMDDGTMYVLAGSGPIPVIEDFVLHLDEEGEELRRVSLFESFRNAELGHLLRERDPPFDPMHTNSLTVLDDRLAHLHPEFKAGNVLVSMRHMDTIAVVDLDAEQVVWVSQGDFKEQHEAVLLDTGQILLFDNAGGQPERGRSRVIEIDPLTGDIGWTYRGTREKPLESLSLAMAVRLSNGNTLMAESNTGRALEVTPDKKIVWEYRNPNPWGRNPHPDLGTDERYASINHIIRLPADYFGSWLSSEVDPELQSASVARDGFSGAGEAAGLGASTIHRSSSPGYSSGSSVRTRRPFRSISFTN